MFIHCVTSKTSLIYKIQVHINFPSFIIKIKDFHTIKIHQKKYIYQYDQKQIIVPHNNLDNNFCLYKTQKASGPK